jgi:putative MATE family efflux protein
MDRIMSSPAADQPNVAVAGSSIWHDIARALIGHQHDYTTTSLQRAIVLLAVPMALELLMESLFAVVDIFWVSRLGRHAVGAVGLTEAIMTVIYAAALGISLAASAVVARRIGERDSAGAGRAAGQVILLGVATSSLLGLVLGHFAVDILELMGASEPIVATGAGFTRIMLAGNVTVVLIFLINAVFRGAGSAAIAMQTLWLANGVNMVLGPCFIFGWGPFPELGVTGAAVATNVGRGIGVLYQLWRIAGHDDRIRIVLSDLRPALGDLCEIVRISGSGVAQFMITMTSWAALFVILASFGSAAVAGYTIAIRIVNIAMAVAVGIANASATLVGQNLGALRPERAQTSVWIATRFNTLLFAAIGATFVIFAPSLVSLFTVDPATARYAAQALRIVSMGFPLYAAGCALGSAFNGSGDTRTLARLNFCCFWLGQVPLAWFLANILSLGPTGVFIAVTVSFSTLALWSGLLFKRGDWRTRKV